VHEPRSTSAVSPESPWLGLRPFTESAREYYFGRDAEVRDIFQRVVRTRFIGLIFGLAMLLAGVSMPPAVWALGEKQSDDVDKKADGYFDRLPKDLATVPRLKQQEDLLANLGDVRMVQGKLQEALDAYQQSLAIAKRLAEQDKTNSEWQRDLGISYEKIANVLMAQGKLQEALDLYQQELGIAKRLAEQDKTNSEWQRDLGISYEKVGNVLMAQAKLQEALDLYQQELAIAKRLAEQDKSNSEWQRDLGISYEKVGNVLEGQGKFQEALDFYQQELAIDKRLAEQDKSNSGWQRTLIVALYKVGTTTAKIGGNDNVTQAREFLQTGLNLAEQYHGSDRQNLVDGLNLTLRDLVK
jgi:tetratricopeptide (TPR) repeat protein